MVFDTLRIILLVALALLAGANFCIWIGFDPRTLSATAYVEQQQNAIRSLNTLLPLMGMGCIVLTAWFVFVTGGTRSRLLLVATLAGLVAAGLITRFANQPINGVVMTWDPASPPVDWIRWRDTWRNWHVLRTFTCLLALVTAHLALLDAGGRS